ncbi:probable WRKY transcription factor 60 [Zingiber officinale]|uniref:WRKY domain-containing protein n=1 Tax=Zingiber officinale TaxID=94328 RepID=A0A8J5FUH0_ZINOF|nr:probable WRKY transcription factor 60 [Zingiber officinale]KAG6485861.1 hypothetical protein ZIOFF_054428 [Zingiber officinale]
MDYDDGTNDRSCLSLDLFVGPRPSPVDVPTPARPTNFSLSTQVDSSFGQQSFSRKEDSLEAQLNKVSEENRRLTEIVAALSRNSQGAARRRGGSLDFEHGSVSPKRKWIVDCVKDEDAWKRLRSVTDPAAKTFKICIRTDQNDSSNVVKDGYRWRKYGQKVTRDSPFPRAYFRCSFAPSCPIKKKVQRSSEDRSVLVVVYEGEHNHRLPSEDERSINLNAAEGGDAVGLVLKETVESPELQRLLVEQMASSLVVDPNFTAAIATAIADRLSSFRIQQPFH